MRSQEFILEDVLLKHEGQKFEGEKGITCPPARGFWGSAVSSPSGVRGAGGAEHRQQMYFGRNIASSL